MSLVKWNNRTKTPSIYSMFDNFFNDEDQFMNAVSKGTTVPAVNVSEDDKAYKLELAAPGKVRDDFKVEVKNNSLCISSEIETSNEVEELNYSRKEYSYDSFDRSFALPENVKEEAIKAKYENGVLIVTIPKTETEKPTTKSIPVA